MALYTFPSNKLEYLVKVLSKLLDVEQKEIFTPTQLIVGSRGMQHWLSIQLAEDRNIAMNLKYDMINGYILDICYELAAKSEYKKAYTKATLTWRIFRLIDSINCTKLYEYYDDSILKKYQLSAKIAEVFSKYLVYRPDWLEAWESGKTIQENSIEDDEIWQMQLWQELVTEIPYTPYRVRLEAITKLSEQNLKKLNIPNDIYIFGVNTISPKNLTFLFELAKYIDINILYVNPCNEYWYDLQKDKISAWLGFDDYEAQSLLANLGQQGKEFFKELLIYEEKQELAVFERFDKEDLEFEKLEENHQSQLISLQRNLLELDSINHSKQKDTTISINSCHSPLREVQVLHDKLLDMIKADDSIKPRDIVVMCPSIEDYSPYIDSVFSRYGDDKKLPCSIADRTLLDSEPLVTSFIDLLQLPESNFEVNKILDYLSVPAVQKKFTISNEQLETIRYWLKESCIHHSNDGKTFSWSWGLKRLMLGFSFSDTYKIINDKFMTVPVISGSEIEELGGLYQLLELLVEYSEQLLVTRTFEQWQDYLLEMFDNVFDVTNDEEYIAKKIKDIIAKTVELAKGIISDAEIDLYTIRYCLISQLSEPLINNHFLNGKVTFCSMTPMRNIPFKVVAMLGLNNGKFPRRDIAVSFDLMTKLGRRSGDRTKRDDDRYLFLESMLSAREYLYLSYVGRNVKTNVEQQSSLILKELINYLEISYNWQDDDIKKYPLHAFSAKCYSDEYRSYDDAWLKLLKTQSLGFYNKEGLKVRHDKLDSTSDCNLESLNHDNSGKLPKNITISKLVGVFDNPLKAYANYGLELYLEDNFEELEDSEPFDIDSLEKYSLNRELFENISTDQDISMTLEKAKLRGKLPESVLTDDELAIQVNNIQNLVELSKPIAYEKECFKVNLADCELSTSCYIKGNQIMFATTSKLQTKHKLELYLTALLVAYREQKDITATYNYLEKDKPKAFVLENISFAEAKKILELYIKRAEEIVFRPSLVHLTLAVALLAEGKSDKQKQEAWDKALFGEHDYRALDNDPYFKLFYAEKPTIADFVGNHIYKEFFEVINTV